MKNKSETFIYAPISLLILVFIGVAASAVQAQSGVLCPFPSVCEPVYKGFKPHDLPFSTGRKAKFKSGESAESNDFYAVILDSVAIGLSEGDTCNNFSEKKRLAAQKLFPKNKAFASHYCDVPASYIRYEGFKAREEANFLALYAGETKAAAAALLEKAKKKYPKAEIRQMRVVIDFVNR